MFHVEHLGNYMIDQFFDIVILGGGHAGVEAAWISSQFSGLKVAIVSIPEVPLASAPCNPAVGGVGKGQVVRELDALGGLMGRLADEAGIQFRTLNESKGFAVQSTRVQIDKDLYAKNAEKIINDSPITVIRERVEHVSRENDLFELSCSNEIKVITRKLVVTTGTFLNGKMHTGELVSTGGRVNCRPSEGLTSLFDGVSKLKKRFKTGTPARLERKSIDFSQMDEQPSDDSTVCFHYAHKSNERKVRQVSCFLTRTNEDTLSIIRQNKERSPIFNGQIQGVGPRYCPSIEDKAYRYEDRNVHHVFVEPEGLDLDTFYPNGISTSLPKEVQLEFIQTIKGLEKAEIAVYGYAVEYDVVDTLQLNKQMEYAELPGLYFAGQVCGTSGYEEAAGQGFVAGVNAALSVLGRAPFILNRDESYIGVMIDDLTANERDEPYRLFTARAENRLQLREDNTILRMASYREQLNLNHDIDFYNKSFISQYEKLVTLIDNTFYKENSENLAVFEKQGLGGIKNKISVTEVLQRSQNNPVTTLEYFLKSSGIVVDEKIVRAVAISVKYRGYIQRSDADFQKLMKLNNKNVDWQKLLENKNISFECKLRIEKVKPENFGQLQRIKGIRPATLAFVAGNI